MVRAKTGGGGVVRGVGAAVSHGMIGVASVVGQRMRTDGTK